MLDSAYFCAAGKFIRIDCAFGRLPALATAVIVGTFKLGLNMNKKQKLETIWTNTLIRTLVVFSAFVVLALHAVPAVAQQTSNQSIRFELKFKVSKEYSTVASYIYCYGYKTSQDAQADSNGTYLGRTYVGNSADGTQRSVVLSTAAPQGVTFGGWRCQFRDHKSIVANGVGSGIPTPATYRGCLVGWIRAGRGGGSLCP